MLGTDCKRTLKLSYREIGGHVVELLRTYLVKENEYIYELNIDNRTMTHLRTCRKLERDYFKDTLMSINEKNIDLFLGKFNLKV